MDIRTKTAFIIGHPVKHSRSPLIHNFWLKKYDIEGSYTQKDVAPENIEAFLSSLNKNNFVGGNVTIPHKETVFRLLKETTSQAKKLKAVNTLYWKDKCLIGDNTDGYGFISYLKEKHEVDLSTIHSALILGAGGAARPILDSLINEGIFSIKIANRTFERAQELCTELNNPDCELSAIKWEDISKHISSSDIIINSTSLGMTGQPPLKINFELITAQTIVYDIVYAPLETELLKKARENKAICIDGLGMLLHQAVPGFEKWFGYRPEVTEDLRSHIIADLENDR